MFLLYSLIYFIALIFILPFEYLKRPKAIRRKWLREKFGYKSEFAHTSRTMHHASRIWIHAVSVGEVIASIPLIKSLKKRYPSKEIILSTITDTGQKVAKERSPEGITTVYLPFDITFILKSMLKKIRLEILIVIETELWPNLLKTFKENNIPVILLNGRISEKSFKGYRKISFFIKHVLSHVDFFGMQNEVYAGRIKSLGVNSNSIANLGNFKFDTTPSSQIPEWTEKIKGHVITAGSTHEGEEELITSVYIELKKDFPDLNLIVAPRHPERFKDVEDMFRLKELPFIKRSAFTNQLSTPSTLSGEIILLDSVGELSAIYGVSDIAVIGKSFKGYGGQNPLEPAYWGKAILCGPHMENFPVIQDFYEAGAAIKVKEAEIYSKIKELLTMPEKAKDIGLKAHELYKKNSGAVERAMEVIQKYIS